MRQYSNPQSPMSCPTPSWFCTPASRFCTPASSPGSRSLARNAAFPRNAAFSAGFTMVEMIAVVLILSLLMGISSVAISGAHRSAKRTHSLDTVRQLVSAWQTFLMDQGRFPAEGDFKDKEGGLLVASPQNIDKLLNTQYFYNAKKGKFDLAKPVPNSIVYYEASVSEINKSTSNYAGSTGIVDRWKNPIYFILDFDLAGTIENPVPNEKGKYIKVTSSALAFSTAGWKLSEKSKYGRKFLVAW